jgi:hypothetical protein
MAYDRDALIALRERVREAEGADRQLDKDVYILALRAAGVTTPPFAYWGMISQYTASIDAALALVERVLPGCGYSLEKDEGRFLASLEVSRCMEEGKSHPLAILDALLSALIERETAT